MATKITRILKFVKYVEEGSQHIPVFESIPLGITMWKFPGHIHVLNVIEDLKENPY